MILEVDGSVVLRKSGLLFPRIPNFQRWALIGEQLFAVSESSVWWIADWLAYGETTFRERYREAIQKTSLNYQTLRNYAWVARRFDLSRRRDSLSFGHHAEVAALERPEQDFWLRKAEEFGWSRNRLRLQVRTSLRERESAPSDGHPDDEPPDVPPGNRIMPAPGLSGVVLKLSGDQVARFKAMATALNLSLEEWAIHILEQAVFSAVEMAPPEGVLQPALAEPGRTRTMA
jgi:hypothetical protein